MEAVMRVVAVLMSLTIAAATGAIAVVAWSVWAVADAMNTD